MSFNIELMKAQLTAGGARPTLFQVNITNPINGIADLTKTPFMVRSTTIPESQLGTIEVPYFGRRIKQAGDRVYGPWRATVINDEDFLVRNAMEQWSHALNTPQGNRRTIQAALPLQYKSTARVTQFSKIGVPIRIYKFVGIYPANISNINLDWDARNQIEEFNIDFEYDYWEVEGGITGNAGGAV
jgi:hypothetical protein